MKNKDSILRKLIREEIKRILQEKSSDEIAADKDAIKAEIESAKLKIKSGQERLKTLLKKQSEINRQKPELEI